MEFKVTIEKLKKGWTVSIPAPDLNDAQEIVSELADATPSRGRDGAEAPKFEATLKRCEGGDYKVKVYKSKLSEATEFVTEMFKRFREEIEAA